MHGLRIEQSGFERALAGSMCCVLGQDDLILTLLLHTGSAVLKKVTFSNNFVYILRIKMKLGRMIEFLFPSNRMFFLFCQFERFLREIRHKDNDENSFIRFVWFDGIFCKPTA